MSLDDDCISLQATPMPTLVVELIEELSRAHTEATFTEAAFRALARKLPVSSFGLTLHRAERPPRRLDVPPPPAPAPMGARGRECNVPLYVDGIEVGHATIVLAPSVPLPEPALVEDIGRVLSAALRQLHALARVARVSRRAHAHSRELGDRLKELLPSSVVAVSPAMRQIFSEVVPAVARQSTTVLLLGETGTGKEVVAQRIHELSPRARRVYVRVNCGAIAPSLLESALFGHEQGAFTGALRAQAGVFERAHEGTLLLDEVGELSLDAQVRLLRVLETGEFERVGGDRTRHADVRVIAATHRDLDAMCEEGRFRRDLFYRLSVFPIRIPPLRERFGDIEPLARHILGELSQRFGEASPTLDRTTIKRLRAYEWPGNVRELENVLERSLILSRGGSLKVDLPSTHTRRSTMRFDEAARRCIADALAASGGRIYGPGGAAAILGLKPTTLVSKMQRLSIPTSIHRSEAAERLRAATLPASRRRRAERG
jgi:transcriptional regulator with GAF, ATPase, and Fis domain